jgi:hypothetical protein
MKYQILKWTIEGHKVWEIIHMDERLCNAYWPKYLKPLEKPSIINQIKDFTNIQNKALKPKKKGRK